MSKDVTIRKPVIDLDAALAFAEGKSARETPGAEAAEGATGSNAGRSTSDGTLEIPNRDSASLEDKRRSIDLDAALAFAEAGNAKQAPVAAPAEPTGSDEDRRPPDALETSCQVPMGYKRLTINLDQWLHKQVRLAATEQETTVDEVIAQLLRRYLEKNGYCLGFRPRKDRDEGA